MPFTPIVLAHMITAFGALVLGGLVLALRKGTTLHRALGAFFTATVMSTTILSFWIRREGELSWIHILSALTILYVVFAIGAVIAGRVRLHRFLMFGTLISVASAAIAELMPVRLLGKIVWNLPIT